MALGRHHLLAALLLSLTACGSKAPGGTNPLPGGSGPTAAFTAPGSVQAGTPVPFDASSSQSADGSTLSYFWEFGGGRRGSGRSIAQVFDEVGPRQVSLTVVDGQGRSAKLQKALEVTAGPPPAAMVNALGRVDDLDGHPLEAVTVTPGGGSPATTDALGQVHVQVPAGGPILIRLSKTGFADQILRLELPASTGADAFFEATLRPRDAALTLADAAAGGTLQGRDGAKIVLPADALVDGNGAAVSGPVELSLTPVDVTAPHAGGFPGRFDGLGTDGTDGPIVSLGTTEFVPSRGGDRLQLGLGKTAEIELPLYANTDLDGTSIAAGQTFPLWSLDESTGIWIQEGTGTVVASTTSPTGLAMRATASHLSWWNADAFFGPFRPKPRCVYDTDIGLPGGEDQFATATICNMLGEIDRGSGAGPLRAPSRSSALSTPGQKYPGFAASIAIPIDGGVALPVPSGVPVRLAGFALNGTWTGETTVTGANGEIRDVPIKMRPVADAGQGDLVTPPIDITAALQGGDAARYDFLGTTGQWANVTVGPAPGSDLAGHVRLLIGAIELGSVDFGPSSPPLLQRLPVDGRFTVAVTPTANAPGSFLLHLELVGGLQIASIALPFDLIVQAPEFITARQVFDLPAGQAVLLGFQTQDFQPVTWRLSPEGGSAVAQGVAPSQETHVVTVAGPGRFWLEMWNAAGRALNVRTTGERTFWAQVAATNPVLTDPNLADLVADSAGAPVLIRASQTQVGGVWNETVSLLRWNGTALTSVGPDLVYANPCFSANGFQSVDVTFDASNRPYVLYGDTVDTASGPGRFNVRRLGSSGWETVGPDAGLPNQSPTRIGCYPRPSIRILPDGNPIVAYQGESVLWVQRLQGNAWVGPVSAAGDSFPSPAGEFELQLDPGGVPVLVLTARNFPANVVRLSATPSWDGVGPNGGALPLPASLYSVSSPRLRFDAAGHPVLGLYADVVTGPGTGTSGITVARFDGASWQVGDGYLGTANSATRGAESDLGFALFGGDAVMAWPTQIPPYSYAGTAVQRNTATGWSGLGTGDGLVPQFSQGLGLGTDGAHLMRLLTTGGDLYMAVNVDGRSGRSLELLRYAP